MEIIPLCMVSLINKLGILIMIDVDVHIIEDVELQVGDPQGT